MLRRTSLLVSVGSCLAASCVHVQTPPQATTAQKSSTGHFRVVEPMVAASVLEKPASAAVVATPAVATPGSSGVGQAASGRQQLAHKATSEVAASSVVQQTAYAPPVPPSPEPAMAGTATPDSNASAAAVLPVGVGISLGEIEAIALANNPTLVLAAAEVGKERGLYVQAGLGPNPTLGYVRSDATRSGESRTNGILVQQTFITANKLALSQASERSGINNTQWQLQAQRLRVLNDVKLRYLDVLAAQQRVSATAELLKLAERNQQAAQNLLDAQQAARTDLLQATVELNTLRLIHRNAQVEFAAAWTQLAVITGVPGLAPQPVADPDTVSSENLVAASASSLPLFDLETEYARLLAESPQLRSVEAQAQIAKAQLARQRVQPIPDVTVQVVGAYDSVGDFGTVNSLIAIPVPLVDRNQGNILNAQQELVRACREIERVKLVLRDQLTVSLREYEQARNEATTLRDEVLPAAQENLELTQRGYEIGELGFAALAGAQRTYQETRLRALDAQSRARKVEVGIEGLQLTGGLNPASIGTAIQDAGGGQRRAVQAALEQQQNMRLDNFAPAAIN